MELFEVMLLDDCCLVVDVFVWYCIVDVEQFCCVVGVGGEVFVECCLDLILCVVMCEVLGIVLLNDILLIDCVVLMLCICNLVISEGQVLGFQVIDVCLKWIDLLFVNFNVIYVCMQVECECEVVDQIVCGCEVVQCICV